MMRLDMFCVITSVCLSRVESTANDLCGLDRTGTTYVKEGVTFIENYPWLGLLYYPVGLHDDLLTTTVVLITKRMALAAALDIDRYPKHNFRALGRVVFGANCSAPYVNVTDYVYHPDFSESIYSTIAIVQLDTFPISKLIYPICPPPQPAGQQIYAMNLAQDCTSESVRIYKMEFVDDFECREFYRRANLDISSLWPTYLACARATRGGHCVWRSGTLLVTKDEGQWKLLGFGVNGPGCESPARFLDYGMYHSWVKKSLARIGRPAITRLAPNYLIMRRTLGTLQRFGICDEEEMKNELFTDESTIYNNPGDSVTPNKAQYNLTLFANIDYSCIILRVFPTKKVRKPNLRLRRICTNPFSVCHNFNLLQIDFAVDISFEGTVKYKFRSFGREIRLIDVARHRLYANRLFYAMIVVPLIENKYVLTPREQYNATAKPNTDTFVTAKIGVGKLYKIHPHYFGAMKTVNSTQDSNDSDLDD